MPPSERMATIMHDCMRLRPILSASKEFGNSLYSKEDIMGAVAAYTQGIDLAHPTLFASKPHMVASLLAGLVRDRPFPADNASCGSAADDCYDLLAFLYNNRAACYLKLGNYVQVLCCFGLPPLCNMIVPAAIAMIWYSVAEHLLVLLAD